MTHPLTLAQGVYHRGRVRAHGLVFDAAADTSGISVAPIAALLGPGDRLLRAPDLLVVLFATPRALRAELSVAAPLVDAHGFLCAFPLTQSDARGISAPAGSLLVLRGGVLQVVKPSELSPERPERWLDLGAVETLVVTSLGEPAARIVSTEPKPLDLRSALGIPEPSPEDVREMERARAHASVKRPGRLARAAQFVRGFAQGLRAAFARTGGETTSTAQTRHAPAPASTPASPLRIWLSYVAASMLARLSRFWSALWPHGRYLRDLEERFLRGDLLEALRRALPIGGKEGGPKPLALSAPGRRNELSLVNSAEATHALPLADDWLAHLRQLYERAYEKLANEGDVEHAAYVLAVLLNDVPRAVQWLERHGRTKLAAELADSHDTPIAERVRLWFLAGEVRRAVDLAVRHGAFADAIERLQARHPAHAEALRLLWAERCAEAGQQLEAARIAWPLARARSLILRWLQIACDEEGSAAHGAWVMRLALDPGCAGAAETALRPALDGEQEGAASARSLIGQELLRHPRNPALDALTTPLLRALLRDEHSGRAAFPAPQMMRELLSRAPVLRADLPASDPSVRPTRRLPGLRRLHLNTQDRGSSAVQDAVALSGGRTLVALGEQGMKLLGPSGATLTQYTREPVYRLVASPGSHLITLGGLGTTLRLGRLDLATRRQERWLDLALHVWADSFDGSSWFVVAADRPARLICLDVLSESAHSLWHVDVVDPPHGVIDVHWQTGHCDLLTSGPIPLWSYELPSGTLRSRNDLPRQGGALLLGAGRSLHWSQDGVPQLQLYCGGSAQWSRALPASLELIANAEHLPNLHAHWPWLCLVQRGNEGVCADVIDLEHGGHWHSVRFDGATRVRVHLHDQLLALSDDVGRVVRIDLERGSHQRLYV